MPLPFLLQAFQILFAGQQWTYHVHCTAYKSLESVAEAYGQSGNAAHEHETYQVVVGLGNEFAHGGSPAAGPTIDAQLAHAPGQDRPPHT
jgi:hypothetical protein